MKYAKWENKYEMSGVHTFFRRLSENTWILTSLAIIIRTTAPTSTNTIQKTLTGSSADTSIITPCHMQLYPTCSYIFEFRSVASMNEPTIEGHSIKRTLSQSKVALRNIYIYIYIYGDGCICIRKRLSVVANNAQKEHSPHQGYRLQTLPSWPNRI